GRTSFSLSAKTPTNSPSTVKCKMLLVPLLVTSQSARAAATSKFDNNAMNMAKTNAFDLRLCTIPSFSPESEDSNPVKHNSLGFPYPLAMVRQRQDVPINTSVRHVFTAVRFGKHWLVANRLLPESAGFRRLPLTAQESCQVMKLIGQLPLIRRHLGEIGH